MDTIRKLYKHYIDDPKYIYKSIDKYIIILEKHSPSKLYNIFKHVMDYVKYDYTYNYRGDYISTRDNEKRTNIYNEKYALFRADKLHVVEIFEKLNPIKKHNEISIELYDETIQKYEVGKMIVSHEGYDTNIENVCSKGILYYKTIEPAFYESLNNCVEYTGEYFCWDENGELVYEKTFSK